MSRNCKDWIETYLQYTDNSEPPKLYKEWVAISTIAAVLQRKVRLPWETHIYPNLYIVLVGPAGKCRKGTAMFPAEKMLREVGVSIAAEAITREALIRELREATSTEMEVGKPLMHSSLTVFSKELTVFLGYNNMQLMIDLTDWYDSADRWTYRTKDPKLTDEIVGVWVNMIGATTPEMLQSTLPRDAIGGGLTSRIIFVYEENKGKSIPAPFKTPEEEGMEKLLVEDLMQINLMSGPFKVTPKFMDRYVEWYTDDTEQSKFSNTFLASFTERRPVMLRKIGMILSAARGDSMTVDEADFERALNMLHRTEIKMPYTFSGVGKSPHAEVMSKLMVMLSIEKTLTVTEMMKRFYYDVSSEELEKIISSLLTMKFCKRGVDADETTLIYVPSKGDK